MPSKKSQANQALGAAMRCAHKRQGYAQESFAARAGLDRANYGAIERGESNVSLNTIVKLAAGLGITVGELLHQSKL
ncbi:MAG TPA: helix-turn-helix transcriptional regulator [Solirubrobacteraceae bacterium]|jgi:transcriptional regulator with XRE-family HTH domain|nr:helix-turn-helix transcriptional regulator [Solirubrobacteraceae bacterium]